MFGSLDQSHTLCHVYMIYSIVYVYIEGEGDREEGRSRKLILKLVLQSTPQLTYFSDDTYL